MKKSDLKIILSNYRQSCYLYLINKFRRWQIRRELNRYRRIPADKKPQYAIKFLAPILLKKIHYWVNNDPNCTADVNYRRDLNQVPVEFVEELLADHIWTDGVFAKSEHSSCFANLNPSDRNMEITNYHELFGFFILYIENLLAGKGLLTETYLDYMSLCWRRTTHGFRWEDYVRSQNLYLHVQNYLFTQWVRKNNLKK